MALKISPKNVLRSIVLGEETSYELDATKELDTKTVAAYTYKIYDKLGDEKTDILSGGNSILSGVITFGVKAASLGKYTLEFIITCNETLPDGTPYEFYVRLYVVIEE